MPIKPSSRQYTSKNVFWSQRVHFGKEIKGRATCLGRESPNVNGGEETADFECTEKLQNRYMLCTGRKTFPVPRIFRMLTRKKKDESGKKDSRESPTYELRKSGKLR